LSLSNMRHKNLLCLALFLITVPAALFLDRQSAQAALSFTRPESNVVLPEGRDFASEHFGDPWDMDGSADLSYGQYINQMTDISWAAGRFYARATGTDANFHPLFPGYDGVLFNGRDGFINRIDTAAYDRLSFRMYSDKKTWGQIYWFYNQFWTDFGYVDFHVDRGWNIYTIDLPSSGMWFGRPLGLRIDPGSLVDQSIGVDWIRLYKAGSTPLEIAWNEPDGSGTPCSLYLDDDADFGNGVLDLIGKFKATQTTTQWDQGAYPPGNYYFATESSAGVAYSKPITIESMPLIEMLEPDNQGGQDYAASEMGNAWDMKDRRDVWYWRNLRDVVFSAGIMSATPKNGDGYIHLKVRKPIDAQKYHRLTFRFRYDGPFDYGAGTMSRFIWSKDHDNADLYQTINDIVTYPSWQTYTIDLTAAGLDVGSIGWKGLVRDFRFDPLEWRARRRFYLDYVSLRADDAADKSFVIKWREQRAGLRPTLVDLYYDQDNQGFDGQLIASNLAVNQGINKFKWSTSKVKPGLYYIYAIAKDGISSTGWYGSGPVGISHHR